MNESELPDLIHRFVKSVNRGDADGFLSFFPHDGVVDDSGERYMGLDAIRRWSDREFIGAKGKMTVKAVQQNENSISLTADWVSNYYSGPSRFVFVLDGERVRELRISGE